MPQLNSHFTEEVRGGKGFAGAYTTSRRHSRHSNPSLQTPHPVLFPSAKLSLTKFSPLPVLATSPRLPAGDDRRALRSHLSNPPSLPRPGCKCPHPGHSPPPLPPLSHAHLSGHCRAQALTWFSLRLMYPCSLFPEKGWQQRQTFSPGLTRCTKLAGKKPTRSPILPWG